MDSQTTHPSNFPKTWSKTSSIISSHYQANLPFGTTSDKAAISPVQFHILLWNNATIAQSIHSFTQQVFYSQIMEILVFHSFIPWILNIYQIQVLY